MRGLKQQVKQVQPSRVELRPEISLVDEYGRLDEEIKRLTKIKEQLREQLLTLGEGEHRGNEYTVIVSKSQTIVLDPIKVARILGVKETLKISTVSVEKARALMGAQIEKCVSEVRESQRILVKKNA